VSIVGVVDLLRGKPHNAVGPDGRMALSDHFRELRARLIRSALVLVIAFCVAIFFYSQLLEVVQHPYNEARDALANRNPPIKTEPVINGAGGGILLQFKLCGVVSLIASAPYWLYQIWAFIVPGLTRKEKRISLAFLGATIPLFLLGCFLGYFILPQSLSILYGLSPEGTSNIQQVSMYFSFVTRFILVFGLGFLFPVVLVGLNAVGVMPASRLIKGWRVAVVLIFVFAAVATPTADPFTMFVFAAPLTALYFGAWFVCRILDKRKESTRPDWLDVDDNEASPL
jgi:sec-independent protein translocase protein TatC